MILYVEVIKQMQTSSWCKRSLFSDVDVLQFLKNVLNKQIFWDLFKETLALPLPDTGKKKKKLIMKIADYKDAGIKVCSV